MKDRIVLDRPLSCEKTVSPKFSRIRPKLACKKLVFLTSKTAHFLPFYSAIISKRRFQGHEILSDKNEVQKTVEDLSCQIWTIVCDKSGRSTWLS